MQTLTLKETAAHYLIEVDLAAMQHGPTLVQHDGQPVAVLLPLEDYQAFQAWQAAHPEAPTPTPAVPPEFLAEVAAYERLKPELLQQYPGRVVAIYQGQVVEVGDDKMDVLAQVQERFGDVTCYVEWVEPDAPRRVRIPSTWVVRE